MDVFSRYAPFIQDFIYRHDWENLRGVQVAAAEAIFYTDQNVLLTSSTASGKTEAAFFPILTLLSEDLPSSVGALYIGPLKALINDQFSRLSELCEEAQIPVWHWHGDVSRSHKDKMMQHPSGILQITPESLEAMLMHRHAAIPKLFGDLRFVVIDEVHSLMRGDRGGQTLCLLQRLSRLAGVNPRRIGLSATIGDPKETGEFLAAGTGRGTIVPKVAEKGALWRISMEHFYVRGPQMSEKGQKENKTTLLGDRQTPVRRQLREEEKETPATDRAREEAADRPDKAPTFLPDAKEMPATDQAPMNADPGLSYIYEHTKGKKCLVFVNSREECETVTATLRMYCEANAEPNRFLIHHGNLSAAYRQSAEEIMKDEMHNVTTVTTSTLELGIDIGRLQRAFQIDAPYTVSSFLQRMGRTGRRGEPPEMHFVMREDEQESRAMLPETLPWTLLQGIALVQLYVEEKWVEPPIRSRYPYSLLYHQTMSILSSRGEMTPAQLAQEVLTLPIFSRISQKDYRILLSHLLKMDHIERTSEGGLIVGLAGERVIGSFRFYAVFLENEEYAVRCEGQELGTIAYPPPIGEKIALAGSVWVVGEVDRRRHRIECEPARGSVPAYFGQCPGDVHTKIIERMRRVLCESMMYPYLMKNARERLSLAREQAKSAGLMQKRLICLGGQMYVLFPWLGSYAFLALERFLRIRCGERLCIKAISPTRPYYMEFSMKASEEEFFAVLAEEIEKPLDPMELLYPNEVPDFEKYDEYVPEELVRKGFALGVLHVEEMKEAVRSWT